MQAHAKRVEKLILVHAGFPAFTVRVPEGAEPVFFRRRVITLALDDESGKQAHTTAHCIGWRYPQGDGLPDVGVYLFVFEDGSSLVTTDRQAV